MGITHKVSFGISTYTHAWFSLKYEDYNIFLRKRDLNDLGSIIHEINEIEVTVILAKLFNLKRTKSPCYHCIAKYLLNGKINGKTITHLISPFGKKSLLGYSKNGYEKLEW